MLPFKFEEFFIYLSPSFFLFSHEQSSANLQIYCLRLFVVVYNLVIVATCLNHCMVYVCHLSLSISHLLANSGMYCLRLFAVVVMVTTCLWHHIVASYCACLLPFIATNLSISHLLANSGTYCLRLFVVVVMVTTCLWHHIVHAYYLSLLLS